MGKKKHHEVPAQPHANDSRDGGKKWLRTIVSRHGKDVILLLAGFGLGFVASLWAGDILSGKERARIGRDAACDLLKELKINSGVLERKSTLAKSAYSEHRLAPAGMNVKPILARLEDGMCQGE